MSKVDLSLCRIHEVPSLQYPKSHIILAQINSLYAGGIFFQNWLLCFSLIKSNKEHSQSMNQFESRSDRMFCRAWSGSKLFAKVISRRLKLLLARSPLFNFPPFFVACWFLSKINVFQKFLSGLRSVLDQSVKQFGSRSAQTFCQAWSGTKLFAKVISRQH